MGDERVFSEETAHIARSAYPKGKVYMHMRDELGSIYEDESFAELFPNNGQPAEAPWCLALVTLIQSAEGLSDRQAADVVRGRIDVKYTLRSEHGSGNQHAPQRGHQSDPMRCQ